MQNESRLRVERNILSIDLTCTNRDLPCSLKVGATESDLFIPGAARRGNSSVTSTGPAAQVEEWA